MISQNQPISPTICCCDYMTDTQMVEANDAKLQSLFMGRFCGPVPPLLVVELPGNVGEVDGRVVLPLQERVEAVLRAQGALLLLVEYGVHFHCTFGFQDFLAPPRICYCFVKGSHIFLGGNFELLVRLRYMKV